MFILGGDEHRWIEMTFDYRLIKTESLSVPLVSEWSYGIEFAYQEELETKND